MLGHPAALDWEYANGTLSVQVPKAVRARGKYAWVFKIDWV